MGKKSRKKKGTRYTPPKTHDELSGHHGQHGPDCFGCKAKTVNFAKPAGRPVGTDRAQAAAPPVSPNPRFRVSGIDFVAAGPDSKGIRIGADTDLDNVGIYGMKEGIGHEAGDVQTKNVRIVGPNPPEPRPESLPTPRRRRRAKPEAPPPAQDQC